MKFRCNRSAAAVWVKIDFNKYYAADSENKKELMTEAVLRAVKKVRARGKFDYAAFERDLINMVAKNII